MVERVSLSNKRAKPALHQVKDMMIDPDRLYFSSPAYRDLLDEIGDGIDTEAQAQKKGDDQSAAEIGLKVWENLLRLMKMLRAETLWELDNAGATIYDLCYWAVSLSDELANASRKNKSFVAKHVSFCESYVAMHADYRDAEVRNLGNIRSDLAEAYCEMGRVKEADAMYGAWLKREPDWGWGWIRWSDNYWQPFSPNTGRDYDRALEILRKGLSVRDVRDRKYLVERERELLETMTR